MGTELLDAVMTFGVRWRLGAPLASSTACCQIGCRSRGNQACGRALDVLGDHAAVCKYGGYKTTRHSRIVRLLRAILRESGATVVGREVEVPGWRRADGTRARLDVAFAVDGATCHVDVT
eukprot:3901930-Karenia_brevis.AAC.1